MRYKTEMTGWVKGGRGYASVLDPVTNVRTVEIDDPGVLKGFVEMGLVHPTPYVDPPRPAILAAMAAPDPIPELPAAKSPAPKIKRGRGRPKKATPAGRR